MLHVHVSELSIDDVIWTIYCPDHCNMVKDNFNYTELVHFYRPLESKSGLNQILEVIEFSAGSYQALINWKNKELYIGSHFFNDELMLVKSSCVSEPSVAIQKYQAMLASLNSKSTDFLTQYKKSTQLGSLEDLMHMCHLEPKQDHYQDLKGKLLIEINNYNQNFFEKFSDLALYWTAEYEVLRLYVLKFLAILPCLDHDKSGQEVKIILLENLRKLNESNTKASENKKLPWFLFYSIKLCHWGAAITPQRILAITVRTIVRTLATRFIAGVHIQDASKTLKKLKSTNRDVTIDQLGELVVSDEEADTYLQKTLDIINGFHEYYPRGERNTAGILRAHISIKVSALCSQFQENDYQYTYDQISPRLTQIFESAAKERVFINIDAEHYHLRDMILDIYKEVLSSILKRDINCETGIVLQAYLVDGADHLADILKMAKDLEYKVIIRLVKGAYWDAETLEARAHNYLPPQFINKEETDLHFRQLGLEILKNNEHLQLTIASHNILDHCWMRAVWDQHFSHTPEIEHQCLHMTYESLSTAMAAMGWVTRNYIPVGDLLVGMAYLVRRIMENSSQVGVLQIMRSHENVVLLREPQAILRENLINGKYLSYKSAYISDGKFKNVSPVRSYKKKHLSLLKLSYQQVSESYKDVMEDDGVSVFSPSEPGKCLGYYRPDDRHSIQSKLRAADQAWKDKPEWFTSTGLRVNKLIKLSHYLLSERLKLSALISNEAGKTAEEALADVDEAIDFIQFYCREKIKDKFLKLDSIGVVAVISPWNFPLAIPIGMSIAALISGNSVILKPSEQAPLIMIKILEFASMAGIPEEAFSLVLGDAKQGKVLTEASEVDSIIFTGSKLVGEMLYREQGLEKLNRYGRHRSVIAEMGGKNPIIITNNCELDETISGALYACFAHAGQKCSAASRIIIHKQVKANFIKRFIAATSNLKISSALDFSTYINPLIGEKDQKRIHALSSELNDSVLAVGGRVHLDLSTLPGAEGHSVGPIIVEIPREAALKNQALIDQEFFAPVVHIVEYETPEQAVELANNIDYALTAGIFGQSQDNIDYYSRHIEAGNIYINRPSTGARVGIEPFGGFKMSGTGPKAGSSNYLSSFHKPAYKFSDLLKNDIKHNKKLSQQDFKDSAAIETLLANFFKYQQQKLANTFVPNQISYSINQHSIDSADLVIGDSAPCIETMSYLALSLACRAKVRLYIDSSVRNQWLIEGEQVEIFENTLPARLSELVIISSANFSKLKISEKKFKTYLPKIYLLGEKQLSTNNKHELFNYFLKEKSYAINIMRHGAPLSENLETQNA